MNENDARQLMQLTSLEAVAKSIGFKTEIAKINNKHEYNTLYVQLDPDSKDRKRIMVINFYPASNELENTDLLQFFLQFPFKVEKEPTMEFYNLMCFCNLSLPLGHINYTANDKSVFYRYVHAIPAYENIEEENIKETFILLAYSTLLFEETFEKILQAKISFDEAVNEILRRQNRS